ncbi:MAG: hypothetical protein FGF53_11080, partial [Candidatus Brockarchaeota archaeon]|nr:hypothetical protein [Candidatus Brockarchaeota archaeon]
MTSLEELVKKAQELKLRGLSTYQIADELKVHPDTVVCLLLRGKERVRKLVPYDVFVDWSPIGSNIRRLSLAGQALADLVRDSIGKGEFDEPEVVVSVEGSGMALGVIVAEHLSKPFAAVKPQRIEKKLTGAIDTSFLSTVDDR